jgi:DNA repair protein RecO (recombination protein O)
VATLYHTTGIVLSRRPWKEADRMYAVFTKGHGKIEVIGRGAVKPLAKLSPHLEFVGEADFLIVRGKTFETVAGVERRRPFPGIYEDLSKTMLAHQALHLVDLGTREHEADPILYDEIVSWLAFLDAAPACSAERSGFLLAAFSLKLLSLFGYRPEFSRCLHCRQSVRASAYRWHAMKGGVVCAPCIARDEAQWFAARPISDETLKLMRFALSEPFAAQLRPRLPGVELPAFHDAVESLIISHFPTIPASSLRACVACV